MLNVEFSATASKYLESLNRDTRDRIDAKLNSICADPYNAQFSKPLKGVGQRTARVGDYRILFTRSETAVYVAHIGPRGQVYRKLRR